MSFEDAKVRALEAPAKPARMFAVRVSNGAEAMAVARF
jgi:hypothetical protein